MTEPHIIKGDDDGIRPAGEPDACFYCGHKVGERHSPECVMVEAKGTYLVMLDGERIGTWIYSEPASWDKESRYFYRNLSTFCIDTIKEAGELNIDREFPYQAGENDCLCMIVELIPITVEESFEMFCGGEGV